MAAVLWMFGTLLSFSLMAVGARELSGELHTLQILFIRSVIGIVVVASIIAMKQQRALFFTQRIRMHVGRNLFHFGGQFGWFLGIGLLPLANVFALEFTVPLWTALIAVLFLKERLTSAKLISIALGFVGVLVIVRPGLDILEAGSFIVLAAAFCYAISHSATKSLSTSENPLTILFYMCLIQLPIGGVLSLVYWANPSLVGWLWLVVIGLTALTAHFCMTKAMQTAEASLVVSLDFLRLPLISLVGVLIYGESLEWLMLLGAFIMLLGNVVGIYGQTSRNKRYLLSSKKQNTL